MLAMIAMATMSLKGPLPTKDQYQLVAATYTKSTKSMYLQWTSNCTSFKLIDQKGQTHYTNNKYITIDVGGGFKGAAVSIWGYDEFGGYVFDWFISVSK